MISSGKETVTKKFPVCAHDCTSQYLFFFNMAPLFLLYIFTLSLTLYIPTFIVEANDVENNRVDREYSNRVRFPKTSRRLPNCIIIGVRKCGTRALLEMLNLHPMIQKAATEMHFFDKDENYQNGLDWYRKRMPFSFENQVTIEKTPSYFITPQVPERVFSMNNSMKLLLIVREPATRVLSDYAQVAALKKDKGKVVEPFQDVVLTPDGKVNTQYKAVRISIYAKYLRKWLQIFPKEQIHVVNGDMLIEDPYVEIVKIEKFLGLDHRIQRQNFYFNKTKGFYCLRNDTSQKCLSESKGRKHPEVSQEVMSKLRQFYSEYNRQFYNLIEEDFNWPKS